MEKFTNWMEKHFVPVAMKIGSQKHLIAIRDAFISIMPITMAGAIAVLLNALVRDLPGKFGLDGITEAFSWLIGINGNIWWGTLAMLALVFSFAIGYQLAKAYDVTPLAGGLVSLSAFIIVTPQVATFTPEGFDAAVTGWGFLNWAYLDAKGLFTAMIVGFISTITFSKLMIKNITIKLPDEVPPAVSKAFASIIPGTIALYVVGAIAYVTTTYFGAGLGDLILKYVQMPFLSVSQSLASVLMLTVFVSIFWFFGLHGPNVLAPALDGIYKIALTENTNAYNASRSVKDLPHIWTRGSFDAFIWMGGSGATIGLIIAILIFSKRAEDRAVAKLSAPMGVFNINEPVIFGLPIVLNPIYLIPWIFVPAILATIAYGVTSIGLVPPVFLEVPWVMPPVIYAWMATGFSFPAALLALFNLVLSVVLWGIFVIVANKVEYKQN
ncbi:PTS sugar transporter subunit IIC [Erysipelothrix urinaevulpis]|uniref:PTS sugar transporter subunit IIC n=1 Tax=Erysipelothrix urinaevulpis TaxID=2683717 RepID=UPI00135A5C01|nr:PTS sugar transporter subunit IIC [Erysipelothrix urinaevulpis]